MQEPQSFFFGSFRLDRRDERLWHGEEVLHLQPKPFAVLCCLLAQAGQLVTKDTLLGTVWPEAAVSESVLTAAIRHLRRVLGDDARTPRFIETVHSRGYRFTAQVVVEEAVLSRPQTAGMKRQASSVARIGSPLFVGRESELVQVHRWFNTALQGTRQVGVIAGEPGVGKTALINAFVAQVASEEDLWVGHGQCVESYGTGEPYLPVLEALGRLGRGPDGSRLVAVLRQYAPSWLAQLPALLPPDAWEALQRTLGPAGPTRMLRELTEALDALTVERPLVLVLEDLHWSDRATLEWLTYAARRPDPVRLLILGTYRPVEVVVQDHPLRSALTELRQHGQCVELTLDYLSQAEVAAYLGQRFGDIRPAADLAHTLHRRTNGNPLFLIALIDELVRQQVLRGGPAGWEVGGGMETITIMVPAHLQALIESQFAHLSAEDQTLLEAASVAGVEFSSAMVAAAVERTEEVVEARFTTLARQGQFLRARGQAEWPVGTETDCFSFIHTLYQEVLYHRLPAGGRTRWHARIGTRLAQDLGERANETAAAVAMHLLRGRLTPQAVPYLRLAGETALARSAHRVAVAYFEQALGVLSHLPETHDTRAQAIDLRLALGSALQPSGDWGRILACLREAETLAEAVADPRRLGQVYAALSIYRRFMGAYDQVIATAQRALALATDSGDTVLQAEANNRLGVAYQDQGDYRRAIGCFRQAITLFDRVRHRERFVNFLLPAVLCRARLAWCHAELGMFAEGRSLGQEGLRIAEAAAHSPSLMFASWGFGLLSLCQGDFPAALPFLERAVGLCQEADLLAYFPRMAEALGMAYTLAGRIADAVPLLTQAMGQATAMERVDLQARCCLSLGEAQLLAVRSEEAHDLAGRALVHARRHAERGNEAYALCLLGQSTAQRDPPAHGCAETHYRQSLALADELGMRPLAAHCFLGLGTLYAKIGQREQAYAELSAAIDLYRAMGMTFWLPQAEAAVASLSIAPS